MQLYGHVADFRQKLVVHVLILYAYTELVEVSFIK